MDDVSKMRLGGPSVADLILIDRCQQALEAAQRPVLIDQGAIIRIQRSRALRHVGITGRDPELVVRTGVAEPDELDASVRIEID